MILIYDIFKRELELYFDNFVPSVITDESLVKLLKYLSSLFEDNKNPSSIEAIVYFTKYISFVKSK